MYPVEAQSTLETFAYDGVGNRTTDSDYSDYSYTALNQLTSYASITLAYDKNGNRAKKSVTNLMSILARLQRAARPKSLVE